MVMIYLVILNRMNAFVLLFFRSNNLEEKMDPKRAVLARNYLLTLLPMAGGRACAPLGYLTEELKIGVDQRLGLLEL